MAGTDHHLRVSVSDRIACLSRKARTLLASIDPILTPSAPQLSSSPLASASNALAAQSSSSSSTANTTSAPPAASPRALPSLSAAPLAIAAAVSAQPPPLVPPQLAAPPPLSSDVALRDALVAKWGGVRFRVQLVLEPADVDETSARAGRDGGDADDADADGTNADESHTRGGATGGNGGGGGADGDGPSNAKRPRRQVDGGARNINPTRSVRYSSIFPFVAQAEPVCYSIMIPDNLSNLIGQTKLNKSN